VGQHKQETQLHNQEISVQGTAGRSIYPGRSQVGDLNRGLEAGFLPLA